MAPRKAYYNDVEPFVCRVLRKQIAAGKLPAGDVDERDVRGIDVGRLQAAGYGQVHLFAGVGGFPLGLRLAGVPDDFSVLTGGFPCNDTSNAGRRGGLGGKYSSLWAEMFGVVFWLRPRFVVAENSAHGRRHWLCRARQDLHGVGYQTVPLQISAFDLGANHERRRVFLLAHSGGRRHRLEEAALRAGREVTELRAWWAREPRVRRVDDGVPGRLDRRDRVRALGMAVVPQAVAVVARAMLHAAGRSE